MTADELKNVEDLHGKWRRGKPGGKRANFAGARLEGANFAGANFAGANFDGANLAGANLTGANLDGANFDGANLAGANLTGANLAGANFDGANFDGANLAGANLTGANLAGADLAGASLTRAILTGATLDGANLSGAILDGANLKNTCLDSQLTALARTFALECPPLRRGGRIVYRSAKSLHVGSTEYMPGLTYTAPYLSYSVETECHPGIYAGSLRWMREYTPSRLVRCYVRDGEWTITAKGCIRCKRLRVLSYVEAE